MNTQTLSSPLQGRPGRVPRPRKPAAPVQPWEILCAIPGRRWQVASASDPNRIRTVCLVDRILHCDCPATVHHCRHIVGVLAHCPIGPRDLAIENRSEMPVVDADDFDPFADDPMDREPSIYPDPLPDPIPTSRIEYQREVRETAPTIAELEEFFAPLPAGRSVIWTDRTKQPTIRDLEAFFLELAA